MTIQQVRNLKKGETITDGKKFFQYRGLTKKGHHFQEPGAWLSMNPIRIHQADQYIPDDHLSLPPNPELFKKFRSTTRFMSPHDFSELHQGDRVFDGNHKYEFQKIYGIANNLVHLHKKGYFDEITIPNEVAYTKLFQMIGEDMAERSYIGYMNQDGTGKYIYCHWSGNIDYNGKMLITHHNSREAAEAIVALGDLSSLGRQIEHDPEIVKKSDYRECATEAYHRDKGESFEAPVEIQGAFDQVEDAAHEANDIEYAYIHTHDKGWVVQSYFGRGPDSWTPVTPELIQQAKTEGW